MQSERDRGENRPCESSARRIGIISVSIIPDDPRVRKQGELLMRAGWEVVTLGLPGHRSPTPEWRSLFIVEHIPEPPPPPAAPMPADTDNSSAIQPQPGTGVAPEATAGLRARARMGWRTVARKAGARVVRAPRLLLSAATSAAQRFPRPKFDAHTKRTLRIVLRAITPAYAEEIYWTLNSKFTLLLELGRKERVDLWLANDWTSLPIARKLAIEQGVPYAYDTHEFAVEEYAQRWKWRLLQRPVIASLEGPMIKRAAFASCVSEGIAQRLARFYRLGRKPLVIRNMPFYEATSFHPTADRIEVLYHGVVAPGRGLEACVESMAAWRPEFFLTIRGPGDDEYLAYLHNLARTSGVADRVTFDPPVPMVDLVRHAARHDVGILALPGHSLQNHYALPATSSPHETLGSRHPAHRNSCSAYCRDPCHNVTM
jgi:glycosyltransferase involved in cell wall biosynthesis